MTTVEVSVDGLLAKATSLRVLNLSCCLIDEAMTKVLFNMLFKEWALSVPSGELRGMCFRNEMKHSMYYIIIPLCTFLLIRIRRFYVCEHMFTFKRMPPYNNPHTQRQPNWL